MKLEYDYVPPRARYFATVGGMYVRLHGYVSPILILNDVKDEKGKIISKIMKLKYGRGFVSLNELHKGDKVSFDGRKEKRYKCLPNKRGRRNQIKTEFKITYPTKLTLDKKIDNESRLDFDGLSERDLALFILNFADELR